jgi:hypothetical protein
MKRRKRDGKLATQTNMSEIPFEVTVHPEPDGKSVFETNMLPTTANIDRYRVPLDKMIETSRLLQRQQVVVHHVSDFSISASCSRQQFETLFRTRLVKKPMPRLRCSPSHCEVLPCA